MADSTMATTQTPYGVVDPTVGAMNAGMPGLLNMLTERESWLNKGFDDYSASSKSANDKYSGVLTRLASRLNDPNSQVSFGLEGSSPVSFMPRQTLNEINAGEQIASLDRANAMINPTEKWAWQQTNPNNTANMNFFNIISSLANQSENRRYGLPSTTTNASYDMGTPNMLTVLGALGNMANTGMDVYGKGQSLGWWGN